MKEEPYSNREIDAMLKEMHGKLDLILTQTTKHNGRMKSMELWKAWILGLMGGGTVILALVVFIWNMKIGSIEADINNVESIIDKHIAFK